MVLVMLINIYPHFSAAGSVRWCYLAYIVLIRIYGGASMVLITIYGGGADSQTHSKKHNRPRRRTPRRGEMV